MDVFEALADPVRREILDILYEDACDAGTIAARFAISRPAISRHLRVLREAGLVEARLEGRNRIYSLRVAPLTSVDAWLAPYRESFPLPRPLVGEPPIWASRLDALETEVFRTRRDRQAASTEPAMTPQEREESA